jgi:threonine dehydratase
LPEADVRDSVAWLASHEQLIVEGSGAIAIAPLLNGQLDAEHQRVAAVLTGRNISAALLQEILAQTRI